MKRVTTNDGVGIAYSERGDGRPLVLIHGWGFSGRFFLRNVEALAEHCRVITIDLRGHGDSDKPGHGYRVPRLAKDLHDVLAALDLHDVTVAGWSLGCPVIWSYLELFGPERLAGAIFIEQPPRQYYGPDWKYAHATCYDDAGLAATLARLAADPRRFDREQLTTIFATKPTSEEEGLLLTEMAKTSPDVRSAIMADHTRHDWRDLLPTIELPSLVLVACRDRVFDSRGPAFVGAAIPGARTVLFEQSSHALFFDEPAKFNAVVAGFVQPEARR